MAGLDERNKADYNNAINLLYADLLTESGEEKQAKGNPVAAGDVDEKRLQGLILSPAQAKVKRLQGIVNASMSRAEKELERLRTAPRPPGDLEQGGVAALPDAVAQREQDIEQLIDRMKIEQSILQTGKVDQLDEDSFSAGLLVGSLDRFFSSFLMEDLKKKYNTVGEFTSQTAQRIGQMFQVVILGSAAATVIGKWGTAGLGGAANASSGALAGFMTASSLIGYYGAAMQRAAITVKNNRRESITSEHPITLWQQIYRGVIAGPMTTISERKALNAHQAAAEAVQRMLRASALAEEIDKIVEDGPPLSPISVGSADVAETTSHKSSPSPMSEEQLADLQLFAQMSAAPATGRIKFGQKAVSAGFSDKSIFQAASLSEVAEQIRSGQISTDDVPVNVFRWGGKFIAVNNRSLAALQMAGREPTKITDVTETLSQDPRDDDNLFEIIARLREQEAAQPSDTIGLRHPGHLRGDSLYSGNADRLEINEGEDAKNEDEMTMAEILERAMQASTALG